MAEQGIPIIGPILNKIIGTRNERFVKKYTQKVARIGESEERVGAMSDAELRGQLALFRERLSKGESADDLIDEAFAVAREAMDRAVGIRNVLNPAAGFDPSQLPERMREEYARLTSEAAAMPTIIPRTIRQEKAQGVDPARCVMDEQDEFLGCVEPVPGWRRVAISPEFYRAVRELYPESRPPFRARPFDVQLIGGMVLCQGKIAEMKTGEGKTIVAPLACYRAAIERMKVHVVTVNDYLVQRDRDWTFPFFHALGMTVGAIHPQHMQDEDEKRLMYRCDVVYGTTAEFGFDYLRDNMKRSEDQQVQRKREFAIVDEVDSILIDEARTPLIISGQAHEDTPRYELADRLARHLVEKQRPWNEMDRDVRACEMRIKGLEGDIRQARDKGAIPAMQKALAETRAHLPALKAKRDQHTQYFEVKEERKSVHATHDGIAEAQRAAGVGSFYVDENIDLPHLLEQSLRAHCVYERDRDYVIADLPDPYTGQKVPSVVIVDTNTGRPMIGRQWSDGLHQAIECKERVPIKQETQTVATITIQNFFKMYKRLAGMTGTADTEAQEFHDIYKLDVVAIPTNRPVRRIDFEDVVFLSGKDKLNHIVDEIKAFHDVGRPILVGTTSVEKSERISRMLTEKHGVQHEVLNAKQHEREAHIVENAGQLGAVMIATNMAGRGTDIKLGRLTRQQLLDHWLRRNMAPRTLTVDMDDAQLREQVYRKIAPRELEIDKSEAEKLPAAEIELRLLRAWAHKNTWMSEKDVERADAEELRAQLDKKGRFMLHRLRWFETIEEMGGLHVIGTERHEARRIDNQLRGRSGRQGDKGSSRFFVALDDDLMKMFAGETTMKILATMGMKEGDAIESAMLSKRIEGAQRKVEERNFQYRKNILEYDEVMEHQRRYFYGMRQRILEGRGVRELVFEFIRDTVDDAVEKYLDPDYPAQCAAEYAKARLDCSITADRLRGKELDELEATIRDEAKYESRQAINLTLGEYMPSAGSDIAIDFDAAGLTNWARNRFGVELDASRLRHGSDDERAYVRDMLVEAAEEKINAADLSGLSDFVQKDYGPSELSRWLADKLGFDVSVEQINEARKRLAERSRSEENQPHPVTQLIMEQADQWYRKREVEYPVEYGLQVFQAMSRQPNTNAPAVFLDWANTRFGMGWTADLFKTSTMQAAQKQLLDASFRQLESKQMEREMSEALACKTDEELEAFLQRTYGKAMPEKMRHLSGEEREQAIRARVENMRRFEMLHFERTIMLETLDSAWKDHLHTMDQLRDTINFRAFSQNDPRIEYKREGSHLFRDMLVNAKSRVTEYVFRARVGYRPPAAMPTPRPVQQARPAAAGAGRGVVTLPVGSTGIVGPGGAPGSSSDML